MEAAWQRNGRGNNRNHSSQCMLFHWIRSRHGTEPPPNRKDAGSQFRFRMKTGQLKLYSSVWRGGDSTYRQGYAHGRGAVLAVHRHGYRDVHRDGNRHHHHPDRSICRNVDGPMCKSHQNVYTGYVIGRLHTSLCVSEWVSAFTRLHFSVDHVWFAGGFLVLYHWSTQQGLVLEDLNRGGGHPVCLGTGLTDKGQ